MSRLDFAPSPKEMEVTDIEIGHFVFSPLSGKKVVYQALEKAIVDAGYKIEQVWIEVTGRLTADTQLRVEETGQTFRLEGTEVLTNLQAQVNSGSHVTVFGTWKSIPEADRIAVQRWRAGPQ